MTATDMQDILDRAAAARRDLDWLADRATEYGHAKVNVRTINGIDDAVVRLTAALVAARTENDQLRERVKPPEGMSRADIEAIVTANRFWEEGPHDEATKAYYSLVARLIEHAYLPVVPSGTGQPTDGET